MDIRHAQWRWDYAAASHGASFHSPVEIGRVVATGIDIAQEARIKLARMLASLGFNEEIPYPDIATKEKAQAFIGLDMDENKCRKKQSSFKNVIPVWDQKAREREAAYPSDN